VARTKAKPSKRTKAKQRSETDKAAGKSRFKALPPPELCGCPTGSRTRVKQGETVCVSRDREGRERVMSLTCDRRTRVYEIGPPQTRTERGAGKAAAQIVVTGPGLDYDTASAPCTTARKGCPVQLVFRKGEPFLRFCKKAGSGKPGHFVSVPDVSEARRLTAEACAAWSASGGRFTAQNPAVVAAGGALGRVRRRRSA
jgi:hypothetical protein